MVGPKEDLEVTHEGNLILIVAKDLETRTSIFSALDKQDYLVATRLIGVDALRYVVETKPVVVLWDVQLEDMPVPMFLKAVRRVSPQSKVILLRAREEGVVPDEMPEKDADDLIFKPIREEEVVEAVSRLLKKT